MADEETPPPHVDAGLVEWLSKIYPERCARPGDTIEDIWMAAGAQRVILKLRATAARQREDSMESNLGFDG